MKTTYFSRQLFIAANQLALILFLCVMAACSYEVPVHSYIHFGLVFLMFADSAYISYKNVKTNSLLTHFTVWLLLSGWQFLLSLFKANTLSAIISTALLPVSLFQAIYFIQLFVFQESAYCFQKGILAVLKITCILATVCCFISPAAFALTYLAQVIFSIAAILFAVSIHHKRVLFVIKNQKRELILSCCFVVLPLTCYVAAFYSKTEYLDNLGSYLIVMLAFVSIHSIVFQYHPWREKHFALSKGNTAILTLIGAVLMTLAVFLLQIHYVLLLILGYITILMYMLHNLLLYRQIWKQPQDFENLTDRRHFYADLLTQMKREEALKKDFSNYLHDNILQDLFSLKNLVRKAQQPEVKQLLLDTLGELSDSIRSQMQAYHPLLLKSLTLKENIQTMLDALSEQHATTIILNCDNNIFLADPYNVIFYRMIKELAANAVKHSDALEIRVLLMEEQDTISLEVTDNGKGFAADTSLYAGHGLSSIGEQVRLLDGRMTINSSPETGTSIAITMPMKGEDSYETIIDR